MSINNKEFPLFHTEGNVFMHIDQGFVPGMRVPALCLISSSMRENLLNELRNRKGGGYFTPALKQVSNVAGLPGIVKRAVLLPDGHAGYGFAVGSCCATRVSDRSAVVSPGGIGFDINCGVRVLRTNLNAKDFDTEMKERLAQAIFDHIPVGVGSQGILPQTNESFLDMLNHGMDWSVREGYSWAEDKEHCEEFGRMLTADVKEVSSRAIKRGMPQAASLGGGNHYIEVQAVDKIYDTFAAKRMGIEEEGQVVIQIHTGSRGFGHQIATDALVVMERHMAAEGIEVNDPQLACARIDSPTGQSYLKAMACAANFAWANRSAMSFLLRQAMVKCLNTGESADDLDMNLVYDVSHNVAKFEEHMVDDKPETLLVHRKGSTRALPPFHPLVPVDYQLCGQPVLLGGSMGTSSHILTGTEKAMDLTFGSCCHGAGRNHSRAAQRREIDYTDVLADLRSQNISVRVASPHLLMEEAPSSYKDVDEVVDVCQQAGISNKAVRMKPLIVIKG